MDRIVKQDLIRYQNAEYRIIAKDINGQILGSSEANKTFENEPLKFRQVNETISGILFETSGEVNRAVLQMREEGQTDWITIGFRYFPALSFTKGDSLAITWVLEITTDRKTSIAKTLLHV